MQLGPSPLVLDCLELTQRNFVDQTAKYDEGMRVYVHGAGRTGREAWPFASVDDAIFADLSAASTMEEKVAELHKLVPPESMVIAHSAGAIPVCLAIHQGVIEAEALVLVEPALYDVARGDLAVEHHVGAMTEARALAGAGDLFGYWSIVRPLMFGGPADPATWGADEEFAARFASLTPPWGYPITPETIAGLPALVVTGGWNSEYEAIARALASRGAIHEQLVGEDHRPQDHPDFESVVEQFVATLGAP
jgi:hypothetical protein